MGPKTGPKKKTHGPKTDQKTEKRGPKTEKNGPKMDEIRTKDRDQRRTKAGLNHGPKADLMFFLV